MFTLGMCNLSLLYETSIKHIIANHPEIPTGRIITFYKRWSLVLTNIFTNVLCRLKDKNIINYTQEYIFNINGEVRYATESEINTLKTIEKDIMVNTMHYNSMRDIFLNNKQKEYYKYVNEQIKNELQCESYYRQIKITSIDPISPQDESYITAQKIELNQKILDYAQRKEQEIADNQEQKTNKYYDNEYYNKSLILMEEFLKLNESTIQTQEQLYENILAYKEDIYDYLDINEETIPE